MPLPTCQCNAGLPIQQQLANIYCALYTLSQGGGSVTFPITPAQGGTGLTSYTIGDLIYASGATTLVKLPDVATGNALISGGVGAAPAWGKIGLTTHVSGILPPANGGTGVNNGTNTITVSSGNMVFVGPGVLSFGVANTFTLTNSDGQDSRIDFGTAADPGITAAIGVPTVVYGNPAVALLAEPDAWISIVKGITTYRLPLYLA